MTVVHYNGGNRGGPMTVVHYNGGNRGGRMIMEETERMNDGSTL